MAGNYVRVPPTPKQTRTVFLRDKMRCQYCGTAEASGYVIEHVIPVSKGGPTELYNLVTACQRCNQQKYNNVWIPLNIDEITEGRQDWCDKIAEEADWVQPAFSISWRSVLENGDMWAYRLRSLAISCDCEPSDLLAALARRFFAEFNGLDSNSEAEVAW